VALYYPVMNTLPSEIVDLVIEFAYCDKFVLVHDGPVYTLRLVEHPWTGWGGAGCMGDDWYWIRDTPDGWIYELDQSYCFA